MKTLSLKIVAYVYFLLYCVRNNVFGTLRFTNDDNEVWYTKHSGTLVTVNLSKCRTRHLIQRKIAHEVWRMVQYKKDAEKLLWLEKLQQEFEQPNSPYTWLDFYYCSPSELEARYYELFDKQPPPFFDSLSLQSLQWFDELGILIPVLRTKAYATLEQTGELYLVEQLRLPPL